MLSDAIDGGDIKEITHISISDMYADELTKIILCNGSSLFEAAAKNGKIQLTTLSCKKNQ